MNDQNQWPSVSIFSSVRNEIHVFSIDTNVSESEKRRLAMMLTHDELAELDCVKCSTSKRQSIVSRAALRSILSRITEAPLEAIEISRSRFGKPFLKDAACRLQFNVSHTDHLTLIAISQGAPVGIDVEYVSIDIDVDAIAQTVLTTAERQVLDVAPSSARIRAFYQLWTRKEALLKAAGVGLGVEPQSLDVCTIDARSFRLNSVGEDDHETRDWKLEDLVPSACHIGALAYSSSICDRPRLSRYSSVEM
jgi:4'-phosphopantetheinyl transferase